MRNLKELRETIQKHKQELEEKFKVRTVAIFGSYARGEQRENSDVDILVEFEKPVSLLHIVSLENHLSDILGIKVDVVPRKNIREELKETILMEAISI